MDIAVPSRFACLKVEDDEKPGSLQSRRKPDDKSKNNQAKKTAAGTGTQNGKKFGNSSQQYTNNKKTKPKKPTDGKQWEEWKKRDDQLVDNNFEQQLQSALLQSKMEFEKQKKNSKAETDNQGKKKKTKTMSLDQFLEGDKEREQKESPLKNSNSKDIFKEVMQAAKEEIKREKVEEERKKRTEKFEEMISLAQCQEKLEEERVKNSILEKKLEDAKDEIAAVKQRNKTLCSMLSQGEMKDKSALLLDLERMTSDKAELTEEVSRLHKLLEQARSGKAVSAPDKVEKTDRSDSASKHNKEKIKKKRN